MRTMFIIGDMSVKVYVLKNHEQPSWQYQCKNVLNSTPKKNAIVGIVICVEQVS